MITIIITNNNNTKRIDISNLPILTYAYREIKLDKQYKHYKVINIDIIGKITCAELVIEPFKNWITQKIAWSPKTNKYFTIKNQKIVKNCLLLYKKIPFKLLPRELLYIIISNCLD